MFEGWRRRRRAGTIRSHARGLVIACIVPLWVVGVAVTWRADLRERAARIAAAEARAEQLMNAVDSDLASSIAALQTMAISIPIDGSDLALVHERATQLRVIVGAVNIFIVTPAMQVLFSLDRPPGAPQARLPHDRLPQVLAERRPAVSDLFVGAVMPIPLVSAGVPVAQGERVLGRLEMVLAPERYERLLDQQRLPSDWAVLLHDRQGRVIAGTTRHRRLLGQAVPAALRATDPAHGGSREAAGPDGGRLVFNSRSIRHGWGIVMDVPVAAFEAEQRRRQLQLAFGALLVLLAGLALADALARRLAAPIRALAEPALAIGRGEDATILPTPLREINVLGAALQQAQHLLRQRGRAGQAAEASLRDSQSRLRLALDAARIGDWDLDLRTQVMQHSPMHDQCFGHDSPLPDWSLPQLYACVHEPDREQVRRTVEAAIDTCTPWQSDFRVPWPDGSLHWLTARGTFLVENGIAVRMLGIVMDITARKQAEALRVEGLRLQIEHRQVLEAHRLKSAFLANMSHELRTPLNAVIGFADVLRSRSLPMGDARRDEYLGHIASSGRHLLRLINDVLDLAKVEAGRLEFHPEPVDLSSLVQDVCGVLRPEAQDKRIALEAEVAAGLPELYLDPGRLRQVLYNYLSNALKFTGAGGRVVVRATPEGADRFRLEVEDDGIGIAPEDQLRLFTPFQQVHGGPSKAHQGTGLGLALTQRLVELQGGSVGLRSAPGRGSVFHAVLPLRMAGDAAARAAAPA